LQYARRYFMKYSRHHILIFLSLSILSCLQDVDNPEILNANPQLIVGSRFIDGEPFQVEVKKIFPYNRSAGEIYVENATVRIYNDDELIQQLTYFGFGEKDFNSLPCYTSNEFVAEYGINYKVEVNAPGIGIATSTGSVPKPSNVSATNLQEEIPGDGIETGKLILNLEIEDNDPDVRNFFFLQLWQLYQKVDKLGDVISIKKERSEEALKMGRFQPNDELEFFIDDRGVMFSDEDFGLDNTRTYTFKVEFDFIPEFENEKFGDLILELSTIDQPGYSFLVQAVRQNSGRGGSHSQPVIDFTNITGGSGIFSGSSVQKDTLSIQF